MDYEIFHKASCYKVGDVVRILSKNYTGSGWLLSWTHSMNDLIGKIGQIKRSDEKQGFLVEFSKNNEQYAIYWFPCFVLELTTSKEYNSNHSTSVKTINDYPHKCPRCGGPAYVGIFKFDCPKGCK